MLKSVNDKISALRSQSEHHTVDEMLLTTVVAEWEDEGVLTIKEVEL